jgi:hypothetical protein
MVVASAAVRSDSLRRSHDGAAPRRPEPAQPAGADGAKLDPDAAFSYRPLSALDAADRQHWRDLADQGFQEGIDLSNIVRGDTRAFIMADTNHRRAELQRGMIGLLQGFKEAGFTHILLEQPEDWQDREIAEVAGYNWVPHRREQLLRHAAALGLEVEFVDLRTDDPRRCAHDVVFQRGVHIGERIAEILNRDSKARAVAITGYNHAADRDQIPRVLEEAQIAYQTAAVVSAGQWTYAAAREVPEMLSVVEAVALASRGRSPNGYLPLELRGAEVDGIIHFAQPTTFWPRTQPRSCRAREHGCSPR